MRFVLASSVKWRAWPDGVVVFSPAVAQTCLLPPEAVVLLHALEGPEGLACDDSDRLGLPILDHLIRIAAIERCP